MGCGCDRLADRVCGLIGQDPLSGHYFVFRSRRGDQLKMLLWDRDWFLLWYDVWNLVCSSCRGPHTARSVELRAIELAMILDVIDVSKTEAGTVLRKNQRGK